MIMSKENGNVAVKIKTTIDRSPVVTGVFRNFHRNSYYNCQHPVHQLLPFRGKKLSEEKIVYDNKTHVGKQNHLTWRFVCFDIHLQKWRGLHIADAWQVLVIPLKCSVFCHATLALFFQCRIPYILSGHFWGCMSKHTKRQVTWFCFPTCVLLSWLSLQFVYYFLLSYDGQRERIFNIVYSFSKFYESL